jgi:shikimate dehydrogenase
MITGKTRLFAIIGDPIEHVRTPMAFNDYFEKQAIDGVCLPVHVGRDDLPRGWAGLKSILNLDGFIVTAPHKAGAAQLCERVEGDAVHTGVANTIRREADGSFTGTLLDGRGFVAGLLKHSHTVAGRCFYLAGAGGAGTALAYALANAGAKALTIHNRTRSKAQRLVEGVAKAYPHCDVRLGTANASGHDVVINATSLGLKPDDGHSFELASADPSTLVAEVVMMPEMTPLLIAAKASGHAIHFGTNMLNGQLALMFEFLRVGSKTGQGA